MIYQNSHGQSFLLESNTIREIVAPIMQNGRQRDTPLPGYTIKEEISIIWNIGLITA